MYALLLLAGTATLLLHFLIRPLFTYLRDPKGLRRYPNLNALSGITDLGFMYEASRGFRTGRLTELHKTHPVIRIGPNSLSFTGVQAIRDIYGHGTPCTKDLFYEVTSGTHTHLADAVDKAEHSRKRKVLSAAYAIKNLEGWEYKVADKTDKFLAACDAACTPSPKGHLDPPAEELTFDYRQYTNYFTVEAIADIGLSEQLGFIQSGSDELTAQRPDGSTYRVRFCEVLHATALAQVQLVWAYRYFALNQRIARWLSPTLRRMLDLGDCWGDIVYHRTTKRLARYRAGEPLDDFFQALMQDKAGRPHNLELGEIIAEVSIMMNAGSDTTAIAMANVMYNLLKHPEKMAKLRDEVDSVAAPGDAVIAYDKVKHLPYLRAVLDESLRIFPPVTFNLPRRTPAEGCSVGGRFIPGDTSVSISAWTAHRDEDVFERPEEFIPERWLDEGSRSLQSGFIPFSTGARGCIGRNISYLEQTVLLASVVHRYEMQLPSRDWEPVRAEGTNLLLRDMPVKIWRRV